MLLKIGRKSRVESGINTPLTVALSWIKWQIAECKGDIALMIVQNAETMGVRESKTRSIRGFYAPKKHFYGCDGSSWIYA